MPVFISLLGGVCEDAARSESYSQVSWSLFMSALSRRDQGASHTRFGKTKISSPGARGRISRLPSWIPVCIPGCCLIDVDT